MKSLAARCSPEELSFVLVDYLRIAGVPTDQIRVLSTLDHPWRTYEYLTRVSQIPRAERSRPSAPGKLNVRPRRGRS